MESATATTRPEGRSPGRRRWFGSGLMRRLVGFNLVSLGLMLAAMLALSPTRDMLIQQRQEVLDLQARLIAVEADDAGVLERVPPTVGQSVTILGPDGQVLDEAEGEAARTGGVWLRLTLLRDPGLRQLVAEAPVAGGGRVELRESLAMVAGAVGQDYRRLLAIFVAALLVSVGLSLSLASMIARPLRDLAAAARPAEGRVAIPDLTARTDEIGRLSEALRGMVEALYDRIDANEQFAADVSHEIKNPLASLRSAVDTLRVARDDQRATLLDIIDHDVRRLDRLVTDIAGASRLDSELVKEEEEPVDLSAMVRGLTEHMALQAGEQGVTLLAELPDAPILIQGLEARLAQVLVNLIGNALSFSGPGDTVRVWAHRRGNRALVVVEDEGPGIPAEALEKIFRRFYSERPVGQFGKHTGLGLSISKQIVEAHRGVIWAENIEGGGARFVVALPA